ncbi:type II toxin-antitoxin system VapC family toxin [Paenibacillus vandeheii]|uniref:type II toxin-antitoxin system VapC family toxin n=1 Tax=Paenibacillus amylolyticus TaxID=1451 RepID=UPI00105A25D9|nr:PIN domain-containing protein [Paenibacillus amylolyticus]TDL70397.1 PIN domain-containing protein [Paenibacillus amylolyticus]
MSSELSDYIDFGEGKIDSSMISACFLDTNVIMAFLYQSDDRHLSCYNFISYLIESDIEMYISEMTVAEVINSLARALYVDDQLEDYKNTHGSLPSINRELRSLKARFRSNWSSHIIKNDHPKLALYNERAVSKFNPFRELCYLISSSEVSIATGLELSVTVPLASSDAMIAASAITSEANFLVSLDKDLRIQSQINILSTSVKNEDYDSEYMIDLLGIQDFLIETLGEEEYQLKFNIAS